MFEESNYPNNSVVKETAEINNVPLNKPKCLILFNLPEVFKDIDEHQAQGPRLGKTIRSVQAGKPPDSSKFWKEFSITDLHINPDLGLHVVCGSLDICRPQ